jgi:proteasome lid subunit RPN8/RPN11
MTVDAFIITQRHYEIIVQQAVKNYPEESGGFLGGENNTIKAILPVFNQHLYDRTKTYAITDEDILRAHRFFEKHGLEFYGVYHTHPHGIAEPSKQDLRTRQKYHFIVSLKDLKNPEFAAWTVSGSTYARTPIKVINNKGITVVDLNQKTTQITASSMAEELRRLQEIIENMQKGINTYPLLDPINQDGSDFSTIA